MSHMEFIEPTGRPDIMSLGELSWRLRHPVNWPVGFDWDYGQVETCALGLANRILGDRAADRGIDLVDVGDDNHQAWAARYLPETRDMSSRDFDAIFYDALHPVAVIIPIVRWPVRPRHVAKLIDRWLVKEALRHLEALRMAKAA